MCLSFCTSDVAGANAEKRLAELRQRAADSHQREVRLDWAGRLLLHLRGENEGGELTFAKKRRLVETLVDSIRVPDNGAPPAVTFRFDPDSARFQKPRV